MSQLMYQALPYPLDNLPTPGEAVTPVALRDAALPLLRSAFCTLSALATAAARDNVMLDHLAPALEVIAGHVDTCRELIDRATQGH
jgi:hypothetical protein